MPDDHDTDDVATVSASVAVQALIDLLNGRVARLRSRARGDRRRPGGRDMAHLERTDLAAAKALAAVREHCRGRVIDADLLGLLAAYAECAHVLDRIREVWEVRGEGSTLLAETICANLLPPSGGGK